MHPFTLGLQLTASSQVLHHLRPGTISAIPACLYLNSYKEETMQGIIILLKNLIPGPCFSSLGLCNTVIMFYQLKPDSPFRSSQWAQPFSQHSLLKVKFLHIMHRGIIWHLEGEEKPCISCITEILNQKNVPSWKTATKEAQNPTILWCVGVAAQLGTKLHMHKKFCPQTLKPVQANSSVLLPTGRQQQNLTSQLETSLIVPWKWREFIIGALWKFVRNSCKV